MKTTSYQVLRQMIKGGNNPDESKIDVREHYGYAISTYPEATVKELASIIKTLSINN